MKVTFWLCIHAFEYHNNIIVSSDLSSDYSLLYHTIIITIIIIIINGNSLHLLAIIIL